MITDKVKAGIVSLRALLESHAEGISDTDRIWDIMSALRGPDLAHFPVEFQGHALENTSVKFATTCVIRSAVLGIDSGRSWDTQGNVKIRKLLKSHYENPLPISSVGYHF